jgi:hypothetical protein
MWRCTRHCKPDQLDLLLNKYSGPRDNTPLRGSEYYVLGFSCAVKSIPQDVTEVTATASAENCGLFNRGPSLY